MKHKPKKVQRALLSLALILGLLQGFTLTAGAETAFGGGRGTEDDPYLITSTGDWNTLATGVNSGTTFSGMYFKLTDDVIVTNMIGINNHAANQNPETNQKSFSGIFDGDGHTLNLNISAADTHGAAPFSATANATIRNLNVTGNVVGGIHSSGLVGVPNGTLTVENCTVSAAVSSNQTHLGGFVGHGFNATISLKSCIFNGSMTSTTANGAVLGGMVGWCGISATSMAQIEVDGCLFSGSYHGNGSFHPLGFAVNGSSSATLTNFYSTSTSTGTAAPITVTSGTTNSINPAVVQVRTSSTSTYYDNIDSAVNLWNSADNGATLKLLSDVTTSSTISGSGTKALDLNGYGITRSGTGRVIEVPSGATLTINDSNTGGQTHKYTVASPAANGAGLATVNDSATGDDVKTFTGGYITGGSFDENGGGVHVLGTLNMNGGTIIGNQGTKNNSTGGGIYVEGGAAFNMSNGALIGNTATYGGGIGSSAPSSAGQTTISLSGGTIAYNKTTGDGGGVHGNANNEASGRINLTITGNVIIEDNHTDGDWHDTEGGNAGGGVIVDGAGYSLTLSGSPTIRGNTAGNGSTRTVVSNNVFFTNRGTPKAVVDESFAPIVPVGVTMWSPDVFTSSTNTDYNDASKFTSDNASYAVGKYPTGHASAGQLYLATPHTVNYDYATNGGTASTKTTAQVVEGSAIDLTPTATKEGWTFVGWADISASIAKLDSLNMGTSDVTLYAIFSKTLTGTFYSGANTTATASTTIYNTETEGQIATPALADRVGWIAMGYNTSDSAYESNVDANNTITLSEDTSYYGVYRQTVTVSYDANGGDSTPTSQDGTRHVNVHTLDTYQDPTFTLAAAITKEGSDFEKWFDGTTTYNAEQEITLSASKTFTAQWAKTGLTIQPGNYLRMGSYNGYDVDWFCARINGTGTMMLSKYVIKSSRFGANATYATSDIHKWLDLDSGGTFATDLGLTKDELSLVRTVNLSGSNGDGTDSFIIPAYGNNEQNKGTPYTKAGYIDNPTTICSIYWLRTPRDAGNARVVKSQDATVVARYSGATYGGRGIRPMFYLDTEAIKDMAYTGSGTEQDPYVFESRYSVQSSVATGGAVSVSATRDSKDIYMGVFTGDQTNKLVKGAEVTLMSDPASGYVLGDLSVFKKSSSNATASFTALSGTAGKANENYEKLVDGTNSGSNNKWCVDFSSVNPPYIIIKASNMMSMTGYSLTTGNDTTTQSGRNWKDWTIYGANFDSDTEATANSPKWQVVTSVTNDNRLQADNYATTSYDLDSGAAPYQYYKIVITANQSGDLIQMSEFSMTGDAYEKIGVTQSDGKCVFTMPEASVYINATFKGSVFFLKKGLDGTWTSAAVAEKEPFGGTTYTVTETIANKCSADHYVFKGYSTAYSNSGKYITASVGKTINIAANNGALYLYYEPEQYNLVLYQDIAGTKPYKTVSLPYGASLSGYADEKPTSQEHYTFAGWSTTANQSTFVSASNLVNWSALTMTGALNVYPIWVHDRVEVKLNPGYTGATSIDPFFVELGATISAQDITRDGYTLEGWYTQKGTKWVGTWGVTPEYCDKDDSNGSDYVQTNDDNKYNYYTLTLTAHWTPKTATVVYDLGGTGKGSGQAPASGSVKMNGTTTLAAAPTPAEGYLFTGWKVGDYLYSAGGTLSLSNWGVVGDNNTITLTAQYVEKNKVKVFFNTDGGTPIGPIEQYEGTSIELSVYTTTRAGYTFAKWNDGSADYAYNANYTVPSGGTDYVTLTASWTVNQYTITFDSLGGTAVNSITQDYGSTVTAATDPTRTHYTFKGWYPALPTTMPAENLTLTAIWEPKTYTASFMVDSNEYNSVTGIHGATVTAPTPDPTKTGFAFDGWRDSSNNTVTFPTYISGDRTYTAAWKQPVSYTVTFKVVNGQWDGGTTDDTTVTLKGYADDTLKLAAEQIPDVGTKPSNNYKAGSWDVEPSAETTITGDVTYTYTYVQKDSISATVTFKVVGGSWDDTTSTDKTVTLTGYEGGTLKLGEGQIPDVGSKPDGKYMEGGWDVIPDTSTVITEDTTFTYIYEAKEEASVSTAPTAKTGLTANSSPQALVDAGAAEGGTMQYAPGTSAATAPTTGWSTSIPTGISAGTYYVWYKVVGDANHIDSAPAYVTTTISASPAPPYIPPYTPSDDRYSNDDSSDDTTPVAITVTVPVSGDENTVNVSVAVNGDAATVRDTNIDIVLSESAGTGTVTIDVSNVGAEIAEVVIPATMVDKIANAVADEKNDADGLEIKLSTGSITFNAEAVAAIADQMTGRDLRLNLDDIGEHKLNTAQKSAVTDLNVEGVYDAYMTSNNVRISDFKGGKALVTIPYSLKSGQWGRGIVVWYVADNGNRTEIPATYDGAEVRFTVEHFSNYVIAYDEARAAACSQDATCPIGKYIDATPTAWYHDGVHWALENGIMNGVSPRQFNPDGSTSRAMVATMLWRLEGSPVVSAEMDFVDVADGMWYTEAIRCASSAGVITGSKIPAKTAPWPMGFRPDEAVTREQLAAMLYRYAQYKGMNVDAGVDTNILSYSDSSRISDYALPAMQWACGAGLISGMTNGTREIVLAPQNASSRAVVATVFMRLCTSVLN